MGNFLTVIHKNRGRLLTSSLLLIIFTLLIEQTGRAEIAIIALTLAVISLLLSYTGYVVYNTLQLNNQIEKLLEDSLEENTKNTYQTTEESIKETDILEQEEESNVTTKPNIKPTNNLGKQILRKKPTADQ